MGPRTGLDRCGKSRPPPPGFDPRTVQPVATRYSDYATRATYDRSGAVISLSDVQDVRGLKIHSFIHTDLLTLHI